jgi:SAM-dependent methyltransferase
MCGKKTGGMMTILYSELAGVYHEMYQSIFDYGKEFRRYDELLKKYDCKSVLEIGCGTGNLAPYFLANNYSYVGLDLYDEMLEIARKNHPNNVFIRGDMRDLHLEQTFTAVIITGRSLCYITSNRGIMMTLRSIHKVLDSRGMLIFDCFNATETILNLKRGFTQEVEVGDTKYTRVNRMSMNMDCGWTWNWEADYYIEKKGEKKRVVKDKTVLRAFTEDELRLFLQLNDFDVLEFLKEEVFVVAARKRE